MLIFGRQLIATPLPGVKHVSPEQLVRRCVTAFQEDKAILEEQQRVTDRFVDPENVDIVADAGAIQARRLLRQRIKEEAEDGLRVA